MRRSGCSACSVAAPMAVSSGERTWMGTIPVPRSTPGAAAPQAASTAKDSGPFASAVQ